MKVSFKMTAEELYTEMLSWIDQNRRLANNELLYADTRNFHYQLADYQKVLISRLLVLETD